MKKPYFLLSLLAATAMLASCGGDGTSTTTPVSSSEAPAQEIPTTFAEQLEMAGITGYTYVDPNAPIYETETVPEDGIGDCQTGASGTGTDYYLPSGGGSYYTLEWMVERANLQYYNYFWSEPTEKDIENGVETATTLAEAAELEGAEYMDDVFPNDGKEYKVDNKHNAVATKSLVTSDLEGNYTVAVYGLGASYDAETNTATFSGAVTNKTTLHNLILTGEGEILVYEYNPTSDDKVGPGNRNYGCRVRVEVNFETSTWMAADNKTSLTVEKGTIPENLGFGSVKLDVTAMYTLG